MKNILYIDDYINLYVGELNKIIVSKPYKNTLKNGLIADGEKYIKNFQKLSKEYNLNNGIFNNNIKVIINKECTLENKKTIINILEELNYKNIEFIQELEIIKLDKNKLYICFNESYFYIYYLDNLGKTKYLLYENNQINKTLLNRILQSINKKEIFIYGKNYLELNNILSNTKFNYYYFEDSENLILNYVIQNNVK